VVTVHDTMTSNTQPDRRAHHSRSESLLEIRSRAVLVPASSPRSSAKLVIAMKIVRESR